MTEKEIEGPISFWGYKEQESNLILPEHDDDDEKPVYLVLSNIHKVSKCPWQWSMVLLISSGNMHHTLKARCASQPVHSVCWMEWTVWATSRSPSISSGSWWKTMLWTSAVSSAGNECSYVLWAVFQSSGFGRGWLPLSLAWYAAGLTWWKGRTLSYDTLIICCRVEHAGWRVPHFFYTLKYCELFHRRFW